MFVLDEDQNKSWVPFKYERLSRYCFGCCRIGHVVKDCAMITPEVKELPKDDMPFPLALKSELNFPSKLSLRLGEKIKILSSQCPYLGNVEVVEENKNRYAVACGDRSETLNLE